MYIYINSVQPHFGFIEYKHNSRRQKMRCERNGARIRFMASSFQKTKMNLSESSGLNFRVLRPQLSCLEASTFVF